MSYGSVAADQITSSVQGYSLGAGNSSLKKNLLINGDMRIDQRNAGASVTPSTGTYTLDRWNAYSSAASKFTVQQNAGSVTPPVGFTNYLGCTSSSAYSVGTSDLFVIYQRIEGFNIADLGWGTANAKTVTLSFQVYSSLTGTFGGSLQNGNGNRSYPFTYSIPVANTWTVINLTIAGDTTGTWFTNNSSGLQVTLSIGAGSTYQGTAGAWTANATYSVSGATSVVGTNGATFYITGVQLEVGSSATGFEYRQYQQELALCQRYYEYGTASFPSRSGDNLYYGSMSYKVTKRATPTFAGVSQTVNSNTVDSFACYQAGSASSNSLFTWTSSAEL